MRLTFIGASFLEGILLDGGAFSFFIEDDYD